MGIFPLFVRFLALSFAATSSLYFVQYVRAADADMMAEYFFSGSSSDTSGKNIPTTLQGDASLEREGEIPYINFNGSGSVKGVMVGEIQGTSPFTISFWVQTNTGSRVNNNNVVWTCPSGYYFYNGRCTDNPNYAYANYTESGSYLPSPNHAQSLFSTQKMGDPATNIGLMLTSDFRCVFEQDMNKNFDCSTLMDGAWHHISVQKDGDSTLLAYIDQELAYLYRGNFNEGDSSSTVGRTLVIGKGQGASKVDSEASKFKGKLAKFQVFSSYKSDIYADTLFNYVPSDPNRPIITIFQPSVDLAPSKTIGASTTTGALFMSITTGKICSAALSFSIYQETTFLNTVDNGKRVCYKAVANGFTIYKLSAPIIAISGFSTTFNPDNIFDENAYKSWRSSTRVRSTDYTYLILGAMIGPNSSTPVSFADINGDGLIDVLYNQNNYRAILANNGDYSFKVAYKCKVLVVSTPVFNPLYVGQRIEYTYYGDCADAQ